MNFPFSIGSKFQKNGKSYSTIQLQNFAYRFDMSKSAGPNKHVFWQNFETLYTYAYRLKELWELFIAHHNFRYRATF